MTDLAESREFWNRDADTYDETSGHALEAPAVTAAWEAVLARLLPDPPAAVLDVGAGTGFLSLMAARRGHKVTACDLAPAMLERLEAKATTEGLSIEVVEAAADAPPSGPFDAVIERHVLWAVPDLEAALRALRGVCPSGRGIFIESVWGSADQVQELKGKARHRMKKLQAIAAGGRSSDELRNDVRRRLPANSGLRPETLVEAAVHTGWERIEIERLTTVEWLQAMELPPLQRLLGVCPWYAVSCS